MKRLIEESPLLILPTLAKKVGLNEAIILQQIHYWNQISKNVREGHIWVYKTVEEWHIEFPFWSKSTIERTLKRLEDQQLIVVGVYNRMKYDRTKWYRVNYEIIEQLFETPVCQVV
ncbi:hypothetical protein [Lysinibacillus sp. SGAir0095]|uniref:hypothetical protein n=1 Tax=Lysinibacillus sp. SGAir0095 TaxID=2070463 RepID=UPI0010F83710|nr:hypothetical protein [Lysinibacillus sp. SGAir0095]